MLAVNINNPQDVPGRVSIEFATESECVRAQSTVQYWLKFDSFRVITKCQKQS
jgi:hypothetical protein